MFKLLKIKKTFGKLRIFGRRFDIVLYELIHLFSLT